ncbi:MAG: glycosyltransferase family 2 protein [Actinomycetales bacterium]
MAARRPMDDDSPAAGGDDTVVWPPVSVIMPVLEEETHLAEAVARVLAQDYPGELEVVLAVGPSRDRTEAIAAELAAADERVRVVPNPTGATPSGLNAALRASRHSIVVRVDGHGLLSDGYIRSAVRLLEDTGAANVGGTMAAEGTAPLQQAVACAMRSPLGVGGARFHVGGAEGPAESVYLGVFRREVLEELGGFDERFRRAQDWELNYRIRTSGRTIWYSPTLSVTYRPRATWRALARQFFHTGQWRRHVVRTYPDTASPRYLAAPVAVAGIALGTAMGVAAQVTADRHPGWARLLRLGWAAPAGYGALVTLGGLAITRQQPWRVRSLMPAVLATMHLTWGAGFLVPERQSDPRQSDPERQSDGDA